MDGDYSLRQWTIRRDLADKIRPSCFLWLFGMVHGPIELVLYASFDQC